VKNAEEMGGYTRYKNEAGRGGESDAHTHIRGGGIIMYKSFADISGEEEGRNTFDTNFHGFDVDSVKALAQLYKYWTGRKGTQDCRERKGGRKEGHTGESKGGKKEGQMGGQNGRRTNGRWNERTAKGCVWLKREESLMRAEEKAGRRKNERKRDRKKAGGRRETHHFL
jgi:hypothetical protein